MRPQKERNMLVQLFKYGQSSTLVSHLNHNLNKVACRSADDDNDSLQVTISNNCQPVGFEMWTTI